MSQFFRSPSPPARRIPVAHIFRAIMTAIDANSFDEAATLCKGIIDKQPRNWDAWFFMGLIGQRMNSAKEHPLLGLAEAAIAYETCLAFKHDHYHALLNLGAVYWRLSRTEESIAVTRRAIALRPGDHEPLINLGNALRDLGQYEEAIDAYNRSEALYFTPHAPFNRALALIQLGREAEGYPQYEARWQVKSFVDSQDQLMRHLAPDWTGEETTGRIGVWAEQGAGDTIQHLRYLSMVAARSSQRLVVEVQPALKRLAWIQCRSFADVYARGDALPRIDHQISLVSLATVFRCWDGVPWSPLVPEQGDTVPYRLPGVLRVGFCWAGNPMHPNDPHRSTTLSMWAPLLGLPNIAWYAVQVSDRGADVGPLLGLVNDVAPIIRDFADTMNALADLDLVISVDSAVAHLAGAMGLDTWMLNAARGDFRWHASGTWTNWYPTMKLVRQETPGDWGHVFQRLRAALLSRVEEDKDA